MIVIAFLLAGILFGAWRARRRKGNRLDMLQYAAIYGLIFAVIGTFIAIGIDRMG